jgi:hypothetical protein
MKSLRWSYLFVLGAPSAADCVDRKILHESPHWGRLAGNRFRGHHVHCNLGDFPSKSATRVQYRALLHRFRNILDTGREHVLHGQLNNPLDVESHGLRCAVLGECDR